MLLQKKIQWLGTIIVPNPQPNISDATYDRVKISSRAGIKISELKATRCDGRLGNVSWMQQVGNAAPEATHARNGCRCLTRTKHPLAFETVSFNCDTVIHKIPRNHGYKLMAGEARLTPAMASRGLGQMRWLLENDCFSESFRQASLLDQVTGLLGHARVWPSLELDVKLIPFQLCWSAGCSFTWSRRTSNHICSLISSFQKASRVLFLLPLWLFLSPASGFYLFSTEMDLKPDLIFCRSQAFWDISGKQPAKAATASLSAAVAEILLMSILWFNSSGCSWIRSMTVFQSVSAVTSHPQHQTHEGKGETGHNHRRGIVFWGTHHRLAGRLGPTPCREGARWTAALNRPRQTRPWNGPSTHPSAPQRPDPGPGTVPPATQRWRGPGGEQILPFPENDIATGLGVTAASWIQAHECL